MYLLQRKPLFRIDSDPYGTRTRVAGVKGRSPRPLDEGAAVSGELGRRRRPDSTGKFTSTEYRRPAFAGKGQPIILSFTWSLRVTNRL